MTLRNEVVFNVIRYINPRFTLVIVILLAEMRTGKRSKPNALLPEKPNKRHATIHERKTNKCKKRKREQISHNSTKSSCRYDKQDLRLNYIRNVHSVFFCNFVHNFVNGEIYENDYRKNSEN